MDISFKKLYSKIKNTWIEAAYLMILCVIMALAIGYVFVYEVNYELDKRAFYHKNSGRH